MIKSETAWPGQIHRLSDTPWRSIKYEEVYLHAYINVPVARNGIGKYLKFYNTKRPHSSLDRMTPDQVYFNQMKSLKIAA